MSGKVAIVMGSKSDAEIMKGASDVLEQFGVASETFVISAHRTPKAAFDFATTAEENGFEVIIAGAGMAAHLPGVLAGLTVLPVIGVPDEIGRAAWAGLAAIRSPDAVRRACRDGRHRWRQERRYPGRADFEREIPRNPRSRESAQTEAGERGGGKDCLNH